MTTRLKQKNKMTGAKIHEMHGTFADGTKEAMDAEYADFIEMGTRDIGKEISQPTLFSRFKKRLIAKLTRPFIALAIIGILYTGIDSACHLYIWKHPRKPIPQSAMSAKHWQLMGRRYASAYNLPKTMVLSVMQQESAKFDPYDVSDAQAIGLMGLMPTTFKAFKQHKDSNIMNGEDNIIAGCKYLNHLMYEFAWTKGDVDKVLRYYNGGTAGWNSQEAIKYSREVRSRMSYL